MTDEIEPIPYTGGRTPEQVDALVNHIMTGEWRMAIEPALTAEEWAAEEIPSAYVTHDHFTRGDLSRNGYALPMAHHVRLETSETTWEARDIPKLIALANDALPDSDPRKITREKIERLSHMIGADESWTGTSAASFAAASAFLDALASYLPPEGT